jgi:hypothetical protein
MGVVDGCIGSIWIGDETLGPIGVEIVGCYVGAVHPVAGGNDPSDIMA